MIAEFDSLDQKRIFSPSLCQINLGAIQRNFAKMGDPCRVMPVIKSDAYGHGLLAVAKALEAKGCCNFAVGTVDEGLALRQNNFKQVIVPLLGALSKDEFAKAYAHNLVVPVYDLTSLQLAKSACTKSCAIALALNTGMGRLGFTQEDLGAVLDFLKDTELQPVLSLSHYACADDPTQLDYTAKQRSKFVQMTNLICEHYPSLKRSLNNSAASLLDNNHDFEFDRFGISLYGGNPFLGTAKEEMGQGFEWAMSVTAPILQLRNLAKGESVSYGCTFKAQKAMTIAVLGIGYATGFNRALSNQSEVLICGKRCPQIGRVCMGMIMVDVSDLPVVSTHDLAYIMGGPRDAKDQPISAEELATKLHTISYEILCLFGATNKRVYSY